MPRQKLRVNQADPEHTTKDPPDNIRPRARTRSSSPSIPDYILRFLNALPTTGDVLEWTRVFRESLQAMLGDVDRVLINIDTQCDLSYGSRWRPIRDGSGLGEVPRQRGKSTEGASWPEGRSPAEVLLEDFHRVGYPLGDCHPPQSYDYYYTENVYLGTIFLLRDMKKSPISQRTLEVMKRLEPFLIFALSDLVARYAYVRPIDRVFQGALRELARETQLTKRELQVLTLHLFGRRYDEIARQLYISIDTVKKHVKKIHRKSGARSSTELFAKYFTPLIDLDNLDVQID